MFLVAAIPVSSKIPISRPRPGDAGRVRVRAADVSTKYLLRPASVTLEEIAVDAKSAVIVAEPPKLIAVPLIVTLEFARDELGTLTRAAFGTLLHVGVDPPIRI
jgi:hypothetical protein